MQRVCAILVMMFISFSLISPFIADAGSKLPSCCKKGGTHHCSMDTDAAPSGPSVKSIAAKCPFYPAGATASFVIKAGAPSETRIVFASVLIHPAGAAQAEAQYRISFDRASQKRGPPALHS